MKKYILISIAVMVLAGLGGVAFYYTSHPFLAGANPLTLTNGAATATATTTLTYQTPGAATSTTFVYDAYGQNGLNQTNDYNTYFPSYAIVFWQGTASGTAPATQFFAHPEYSDGADGVNCRTAPTACDWYPYNSTAEATTTNPINVSVTGNTVYGDLYSWVFASSTIGGVSPATAITGIAGLNNRDHRAIKIPVIARYVRVVYWVMGANGAQYLKILPYKELR